MNRFAIPFLLGLVLAAPATLADRAPMQPGAIGGHLNLSERDAVDFALDDADRDRVETWKEPASPFARRVLVGPTWAVVFRGDPHQRPVFRITKSAVTTTFTHENYIQQITYAVDGVLSLAGREIPIHAEGQGSTGRSALYGFPAALAQCIRDAANRAVAAAR